MFPTIVKLDVLPGFRLWLKYDDGASGEVDFNDVIALGGVFAPLEDPGLFARVQIGERGRFIVFPGEVDFCADALRSQIGAAESVLAES